MTLDLPRFQIASLIVSVLVSLIALLLAMASSADLDPPSSIRPSLAPPPEVDALAPTLRCQRQGPPLSLERAECPIAAGRESECSVSATACEHRACADDLQCPPRRRGTPPLTVLR
jgi:hypothetical protein